MPKPADRERQAQIRRSIRTSLTDLASVGSLISSVAVLISLIYLALQVRQAEKNQQASIRQGRATRAVDIILAAGDPALAAPRLELLAAECMPGVQCPIAMLAHGVERATCATSSLLLHLHSSPRRARDESLSALRLAREHEHIVAYCDFLCALHRLHAHERANLSLRADRAQAFTTKDGMAPQRP